MSQKEIKLFKADLKIWLDNLKVMVKRQIKILLAKIPKEYWNTFKSSANQYRLPVAKQMLIYIVQHNYGFTKKEFCNLLELSSPNHNVDIAIPILMEKRLMVWTTTTDARESYELIPVVVGSINYAASPNKLIPSVVASIDYTVSPNNDPVLGAQMTLGWQQVKNERKKERQIKGSKNSKNRG